MACILNIETSTDVSSVAVSENGACIFNKEDHIGVNHAETLGPNVDEAMSFADSHAIPIDAVAVSCGPGSYTGLRIGVSMAKGICYGLNIPLLSVSTLELMCVPVLLSSEHIDESALLCPMLDARRMEVYSGIYDRGLRTVREVRADIVDGDTYSSFTEKRPVYFFGNGASKCKETIGSGNAHFIDNVEPLAKWMFPLAEKKLLRGETEDVAYFEPFYLKDFVAKTPHKLL